MGTRVFAVFVQPVFVNRRGCALKGAQFFLDGMQQ
jgi:hypothetical protein